MYLLQRRADGKFWKNKASYSRWWNGELHWTDNPSECKPFNTPGAAMKSRGASIPLPFPRPAVERRTPEAAAVWGDYWQKMNHWYSQKNLPARKAVFNEKYQVIEVEIRVKES